MTLLSFGPNIGAHCGTVLFGWSTFLFLVRAERAAEERFSAEPESRLTESAPAQLVALNPE
jgi:hypothetical protein